MVRCCRRLTEYRHIHHHHHHQQQHQQPYEHQSPDELPVGAWSAAATTPPGGVPLGPAIVFNPPGVDWQRAQAAALRLAVDSPLPAPSGRAAGSFAPNVPPRRCRPVAGDGNCLFRAISWWITGSEQQHVEVQRCTYCASLLALAAMITERTV